MHKLVAGKILCARKSYSVHKVVAVAPTQSAPTQCSTHAEATRSTSPARKVIFMVNDFLNDREGEFPGAFEDFLTAKAEGNLMGLDLSEEAFEYVLERLLDEGGEECDDDVLNLSGIAF